MKKNLVKWLCLVLALVMAVATLSACNGKQTAEDLKERGAWKGEKIFETDEELIANYTFRVSAFRDFGSDPLNHQYADGANVWLEQHPGAKVQYLSVGDHQPEAIAAAVASGDVWDIQHVFTCSQMPGDIVDGLYEPIDGYFDLNDERINKGTSSGAYFDGHWYGVSNEVMQECEYLSYNETLFKENNIKTPHEYYAEGKWDINALDEIVGKLHDKGFKISFNLGHPSFNLKHATRWNEDYTDVEIVLGSTETRRYFDILRKWIYDWEINTSGNVANRSVAISAHVIPNLTETNIINSENSTDVIRYIYCPGIYEDEKKPYIDIADANFMVPSGANPDMKAAAIDLAIEMGMGRKNHLVDYYKKNMVEEDYNLLMEAMQDERPLERGFSPDFMYYNFNFTNEMKAGKPVSTYISEIEGKLHTLADKFRAKLAEYRDYTGLSNEE